MNIQTAAVKQDKCIIEFDDGLPYGTSRGYWVLTPDGQVHWATNKKDAEKICKTWFKKDLGNDGVKIGIGSIEWRM